MLVCLRNRHPDKNPANQEEAKVRFQEVHAAYKKLQKILNGEDDSDEEELFTEEDDVEAAMEFFAFMYALPFSHSTLCTDCSCMSNPTCIKLASYAACCVLLLSL